LPCWMQYKRCITPQPTQHRWLSFQAWPSPHV